MVRKHNPATANLDTPSDVLTDLAITEPLFGN